MAFSYFPPITRPLANNSLDELGLSEPPPGIIISAPLVNSVARPTLYIKVKAVSNSDSVRLTIYNQSTVLANYYDSIDNYLDLSTYEGTLINLTIKATDKNNQVTSSNPIPIYVESSHLLKEIYQASDRILDFNYSKLLATDEINYSHPRIINISDGTEENLTVKDSVRTGYLTSDGSMLESSFNNLCTLYEYNNGQVINLGVADQIFLKVAGMYGIWHKNNGNIFSADSLFRRNTATGETTVIRTTVQTQSFYSGLSNSDVAKNGTTVYIDSLSSVVKFENNSTSVITYPGFTIHRFPLTDGYHIVYQEQQGPAYYSFLESSNGRYMLFTGLRGNVLCYLTHGTR